MDTITLSNNLQLPKLGLGMWDSYNDEAVNAILTALDLGYRHIDTAMFYKNEVEVGQAIKQSPIPREEIFVTTKIWYTDMHPETVRETFEKSLENLQLDYVDLYLLHWPLEDFVGSWKVLEELYEEGRVKAIGVCNFQKHHMEALLKEAKIKPMINQIESHPTFSQKDLVDYCTSLDIPVVVWGPLGKGADLDHEVIVSLADKYAKTPAQIILRWHMQRGVAAIPKSVKKHRLEENMNVFDFELTAEDMEKMNALDTGVSNRGYQPGYTWE